MLGEYCLHTIDIGHGLNRLTRVKLNAYTVNSLRPLVQLRYPIIVGLIVLGAFTLGRYLPERASDSARPPSAEATSAPVATRLGPREPSGSTPRQEPVKSQRDMLFESLLEHLRFGRHQAAVEIYDQVYTQFNETTSEPFRTTLLDQAATLLNHQPHKAVDLLQRYTAIFFRDIAALQLLANGHTQLRNYEQALRRFQDAYIAAHTAEDLDYIQSKIDSVVRLYTNNLHSAEDNHGLVALFSALIERQPDHAPYYLGLADAYIQNNEPRRALNALRYIQYDGILGAQAQRRIADLEDRHGPQPPSEGTVVPFVPIGNNFLVAARINAIPAHLMLDTGASVTVVTTEFARRVGLRWDDTRLVSLDTANGRVRAPVATIARLEVGSEVLTNLRVVVVELDGLRGIDGLLGMDVLSRYRVTIDRSQNSLILAQ